MQNALILELMAQGQVNLLSKDFNTQFPTFLPYMVLFPPLDGFRPCGLYSNRDLLVPMSLVILGFSKFLGSTSLTASDVPGIIFPAIYYYRIMTKKVS